MLQVTRVRIGSLSESMVALLAVACADEETGSVSTASAAIAGLILIEDLIDQNGRFGFGQVWIELVAELELE